MKFSGTDHGILDRPFELVQWLVLTVVISCIFIGPASGSDLKLLEEKRGNGWKIGKLMSTRDGISCQALRCNVKNCKSPRAIAGFKLHGSQKRRAITPMVGARFAENGSNRAVVSVGNLRNIPMEHRPKSIGRMYVPVHTSDDDRLVLAMLDQTNKTVLFQTEKGQAEFKLEGMKRVMDFFETKCGIPAPK